MALSRATGGRSSQGLGGDYEEQLVKCVKQLVIHCMPYLRDAGSAEGAEDAILHMEENDENFHR